MEGRSLWVIALLLAVFVCVEGATYDNSVYYPSAKVKQYKTESMFVDYAFLKNFEFYFPCSISICVKSFETVERFDTLFIILIVICFARELSSQSMYSLLRHSICILSVK